MSPAPPADEDAFCEALQAAVDQFMSRVLAAFASAQDWREQLRAVAWEMLRFLEEDAGRAHMMMIEAPEAGERALEIRDQGIAGLIELIDLGRSGLADSDSLTRATAEGLAATIYGHIYNLVKADEIEAGYDLIPELMAFAVTPYFGLEAAREELRMPPPPPRS